MTRSILHAIASFATVGLCAWGLSRACAQTPPSVSRGELLYSTHCIGCHNTQVHWRDHRLAKDWSGLRAQVRRWQANAGLGWSDEEVSDVTRYLNGLYYHFAPPATRATGSAPALVANAARRKEH